MIPVDDNISLGQLINLDGLTKLARPLSTTPAMEPLVTKQFGGGENMQVFRKEIKSLGQGVLKTIDQTRFLKGSWLKGRGKQGGPQLIIAEYFPQVFGLPSRTASKDYPFILLLP